MRRSPAPVQRSSTSPSPLKNDLPPPHVESTWIPESDAVHDPDCTMSAALPSSGTTVMSPGRTAATPTTPPCPDEKSLTKKLSPPSDLRRPLHEPAAGVGGHLYVAPGHRHGARLDTHRAARRQGDLAERERRTGMDVDPHVAKLTVPATLLAARCGCGTRCSLPCGWAPGPQGRSRSARAPPTGAGRSAGRAPDRPSRRVTRRGWEDSHSVVSEARLGT